MIRQGDIVFFKNAKRSSRKKAPTVEFQGHGFGLFLGHVPNLALDPPLNLVIRLIGSLGFVTFDDIKDFFGDEILAECLKKYGAKYPLPQIETLPVKAEEKTDAEERSTPD